jgi:hypothetical protein
MAFSGGARRTGVIACFVEGDGPLRAIGARGGRKKRYSKDDPKHLDEHDTAIVHALATKVTSAEIRGVVLERAQRLGL